MLLEVPTHPVTKIECPHCEGAGFITGRPDLFSGLCAKHACPVCFEAGWIGRERAEEALVLFPCDGACGDMYELADLKADMDDELTPIHASLYCSDCRAAYAAPIEVRRLLAFRKEAS